EIRRQEVGVVSGGGGEAGEDAKGRRVDHVPGWHRRIPGAGHRLRAVLPGAAGSEVRRQETGDRRQSEQPGLPFLTLSPGSCPLSPETAPLARAVAVGMRPHPAPRGNQARGSRMTARRHPSLLVTAAAALLLPACISIQADGVPVAAPDEAKAK